MVEHFGAQQAMITADTRLRYSLHCMAIFLLLFLYGCPDEAFSHFNKGRRPGSGMININFMLPDGDIEVHMAQHASIQA